MEPDDYPDEVFPTGGAEPGANRVLMVCFANQCRSPMMEGILAADLHLLGLPGWSVWSAGTNVVADTYTHPLTVETLRRLNIWYEGRPAQQLTAELVSSVDLVVTAERSHRAAVARLHPPAVQYSFTLRQLARLCNAARTRAPGRGVRDVSDILELAAIGRPRVQPVSRKEDDIEDPIGHDLSRFVSVGSLIQNCIGDVFGIT